MRILVVDDDEAIRELLRDLFGHAHHEVECACDGAEALARLKHGPAPDLVVLDLLMPQMSGWQLLEAIEDDPALASIPVVILSSVDSRADLPAGRPLIQKPVNDDVMLGLVSTLSEQEAGYEFPLREPPANVLPGLSRRPPRTGWRH